MPFENPEPGTYWGYRCVKCGAVIALTEYQEGTAWRGDSPFTLTCMNWDCRFQADYPITDIRPIDVTPAA